MKTGRKNELAAGPEIFKSSGHCCREVELQTVVLAGSSRSRSRIGCEAIVKYALELSARRAPVRRD
jgi:hypothetical protein